MKADVLPSQVNRLIMATIIALRASAQIALMLAQAMPFSNDAAACRFAIGRILAFQFGQPFFQMLAQAF